MRGSKSLITNSLAVCVFFGLSSPVAAQSFGETGGGVGALSESFADPSDSVPRLSGGGVIVNSSRDFSGPAGSTISGMDITSGVGQKTLRELNAVLAFQNPQDWLNSLPQETGTWTDFDGAWIDITGNPIFEPENWEVFQEILPYIMPVGPDGTLGSIGTPSRPGVTRVPLAGGVIHLKDPSLLDWDGGLTGDKSCFVPQEVSAEVAGRGINSIRLQTVLVAALGRAIETYDKKNYVYRYERCSADVKTAPVLHCSGIMEPDGKTVWTAAHCLRNGELSFVEEPLRNIPAGEERLCSESTLLRVVQLLGLTKDDFVVAPKLMSTCESITYFNPDVVRVRLTEALPASPLDGVAFSPWRWPKVGELEQLLVDGRRLFGAAYPQSPEMRDIMGGRIMTVEHCYGTLAGLLGYRGEASSTSEVALAVDRVKREAPPGTISHKGYGCTTMDTMNGGSGGPVFALGDDGETLILIGLVSGAAWVSFEKECLTENENPLTDECGVPPTGGLNVFSLLPDVDGVTLVEGAYVFGDAYGSPPPDKIVFPKVPKFVPPEISGGGNLAAPRLPSQLPRDPVDFASHCGAQSDCLWQGAAPITSDLLSWNDQGRPLLGLDPIASEASRIEPGNAETGPVASRKNRYSFPTAVGLQSASGEVKCGGVLVSPFQILTDKKCVCEQRPEFVYFGETLVPSRVRGQGLRTTLALRALSSREVAKLCLGDESQKLAILETETRLPAALDAALRRFDPIHHASPAGKIFFTGFGEAPDRWRPGDKSFMSLDLGKLTCPDGATDIETCPDDILSVDAAQEMSTCPGDVGTPVFLQMSEGEAMRLWGITVSDKSAPDSCLPGRSVATLNSDNYSAWFQGEVSK